MIIALSGWKGSGKDTFASCLKEHGFQRVAFADVLKKMTADVYNIPLEVFHSVENKEMPLMNLPALVSDRNTDNLVNMMKGELKYIDGLYYWTPRALLIYEGSVKRAVDRDYWVKAAISDLDPRKNYVITDLRYKSEVNTLKNSIHDVFFTRINRFTESPSNDPSERDLDDQEFDFSIQNNSIDGLKESAMTMVDVIDYRYIYENDFDKCRDQVRNQGWMKVSNKVDSQVRIQVWRQVDDKVWMQVENQAWSQVRDQVWDQVYIIRSGIRSL